MEREIERACGLDVHRDTVAACVRVPEGPGQRTQHVHTVPAAPAGIPCAEAGPGGQGEGHTRRGSAGEGPSSYLRSAGSSKPGVFRRHYTIVGRPPSLTQALRAGVEHAWRAWKT
jgi:hypothetical protein